MNQEKIYTAEDVAKILRVNPKTIGRYCKKGAFPGAYKTGLAVNSHWRIPQSGLDSYLRKIGRLQA